MTDEDFKSAANCAHLEGAYGSEFIVLFQACIDRVTHGVTCIHERDGWRILKTQGGADVGVIAPTWCEAVVLFARTLI